MQLNVTGHHVEVTESMRGYVEKKLERIAGNNIRMPFKFGESVPSLWPHGVMAIEQNQVDIRPVRSEPAPQTQHEGAVSGAKLEHYSRRAVRIIADKGLPHDLIVQHQCVDALKVAARHDRPPIICR